MVVGAATGMGFPFQKRTHRTQRGFKGSILRTIHQRRTGSGAVKPHNHAHRCGFTGSVWSQKPGDFTVGNREGNIINGSLFAVPLAEVLNL